jgi:hypothetical protein
MNPDRLAADRRCDDARYRRTHRTVSLISSMSHRPDLRNGRGIGWP